MRKLKLVVSLIVSVFAIISFSLLVMAPGSPPPCAIDVGDFCTETQGGWGGTCSGNNPSCLRDNNWNLVTGGKLVVGKGKNITFTNSSAVKDYLPSGGTAAKLNHSYTNPDTTESGVLGGQVTALELNVLFSDAGLGLIDLGSDTPLGELFIVSGKFTGLTVYQFLELAEKVLGGNTALLNPFSASVSDLNDAAEKINKNFDNCAVNKGFLEEKNCETPRCGDGKINQDLEECDDGNTINNDGCSSTCKLEGSITVCKIILDSNGNIVNGSANFGQFKIPGIIPVQTSQPAPVGQIGLSQFTTPLQLNTNLFGDSKKDAKCVKYSGLKLGGYYYGEETINGTGWKKPLYNDQHLTAITTLNDFYEYDKNLFDGHPENDSLRNTNADGHITLVASRPNRTLVILNQYLLKVCGNGIVEEEEQCDDGNTNNNDACMNNCKFNETCRYGTNYNSGYQKPTDSYMIDKTTGGRRETDDNGQDIDQKLCKSNLFINVDLLVNGSRATRIIYFEWIGENGKWLDNLTDDYVVNTSILLPQILLSQTQYKLQILQNNNWVDVCRKDPLGFGNLSVPICSSPTISLTNYITSLQSANNVTLRFLTWRENEPMITPLWHTDVSCVKLNVTANCPPPVRCGDGVKQNDEQCDDGNLLDSDECSNTCKLTYCPDGILQNPNGYGFHETCDDGNDVNGDGCDSNCQDEFCGDGIVNDVDEQCDDGDEDNDDACSNSCTLTPCGDEIVQNPNGYGFPEECDDGNILPNDGCFNCVLEECGDEIVQPPEQCDDGNENNNDLCSNSCDLTPCGDGIIQNPNGYGFQEQCDDGNLITTDLCNQCVLTPCGDEIVQNPNGYGFPEECDDGNLEPNDGCFNCVLEECGDEIVQPPEQCDDGNENNNDLCSNLCQYTFCPDGILQNLNGEGDSEECDDGNLINEDGCSTDCVVEYCGDGTIQEDLGENCDDGNNADGDGCNSDCQNEYCGDGILQPLLFEQCDDGNLNDTDSCSNACKITFCGDRVIQPPEQCDDGNTNPFDGCNATCNVEYCGDGVLQPSEECDDGNQLDGDGCSSVCNQEICEDKEPPFTIKYYGPPLILNETSEWINSNTPVYLEAQDAEGECPSGVNKTYWRNTIVDNRYCQNQQICQQAQGLGDWVEYIGPFYKPSESCHLIEYRSTDKAGNNETIRKQCAFVDNQGPRPIKTVGNPHEIWNGEGAYFYDIAERCWNGLDNSIDCWRVTLNTSINMKCEDRDPHPVKNETIYFNVDLDGEDATEKYCEHYGGTLQDNGYCLIEQNELTIFFLEETEHNLDFYCADALGNIGVHDDEKFKVEGSGFEIELFRKWNLISVPFVLLNDSPENVFKDMKNVSAVWTYDGEANGGLGAWLGWSPDVPEFMNDLKQIKPGWGYWVLEKNDYEKLIVGGSLFKQGPNLPPSKPLTPGWNLIGYYGTQWQQYNEMEDLVLSCGDEFSDQANIFGTNVYCSLGSLVDTQQGTPRWSSLWGFNNCGNHNTEWISLNACTSDINNIYAGRGYWVEINVPEIYAPATTCIVNAANTC